MKQITATLDGLDANGRKKWRIGLSQEEKDYLDSPVESGDDFDLSSRGIMVNFPGETYGVILGPGGLVMKIKPTG